MTKLYWQLRKAMSRRKDKCGSIVKFITNNRHHVPELRTYPCNRWGSGYWSSKGRRW